MNAENNQVLIEVKELKKAFGDNRVLDGISTDIHQGEVVAIIGPSGSGKSTFLRSLNLMEVPTGGQILFEGTDITDPKVDINRHRQKIGMVFQQFNLFPHKTVKENIMLPVLLDKKEQKECEEKAEALEKQFGIEHLQEKNPYELSGGERQRVAICRALINDPSIIFADEPTGNLDSKSGKVVAEEFRKINEELGKTLLMVTHDPQMASRCKRVIFLKDGYVMNDVRKEGTEEEFYRTIIGEMEKF